MSQASPKACKKQRQQHLCPRERRERETGNAIFISAEGPPSEDSISASASPRIGPVRAHPYMPLEGSVERSSFEMVPSSVSQAPCASGIEESLSVTPIPKANSCPSILPIRIHSLLVPRRRLMDLLAFDQRS